MKTELVCFTVGFLSTIIGLHLLYSKPHYEDGMVVCVALGAPDVNIISHQIRYLGEGKWEFRDESGKMSIFEKGAISGCFMVHRPEETGPVIKKAPDPVDRSAADLHDV